MKAAHWNEYTTILYMTLSACASIGDSVICMLLLVYYVLINIVEYLTYCYFTLCCITRG